MKLPDNLRFSKRKVLSVCGPVGCKGMRRWRAIVIDGRDNEAVRGRPAGKPNSEHHIPCTSKL